MVIGKILVTGDLEPPLPQIGAKTGGIADAAEREQFARTRLGRFRARVFALIRANGFEISPRVENGSVGIEADGSFNGRSMIAAGDHHDVGARERRSRLAQPSRGQQMASAEWIRRINQDDVHVARELRVLETVVENKPLPAAPCYLPSVRKPMDAHAKRDALAQA